MPILPLLDQMLEATKFITKAYEQLTAFRDDFAKATEMKGEEILIVTALDHLLEQATQAGLDFARGMVECRQTLLSEQSARELDDNRPSHHRPTNERN